MFLKFMDHFWKFLKLANKNMPKNLQKNSNFEQFFALSPVFPGLGLVPGTRD